MHPDDPVGEWEAGGGANPWYYFHCGLHAKTEERGCI